MITLRPYQQEIARAVLRSVRQRAGLTFTVEIARQGGKNELSAQLELLLMTLYAGTASDGIKAAPTWRPQALTSLRRLKTRLAEANLPFSTSSAYQVHLGAATWSFLSGKEGSSVVGATATILLEGDEAQDLLPQKWDRDFRPMGATSNATSVLYGTAWAADDLLEREHQANLELEHSDGQRRHWHIPWDQVAEHNPLYARYVTRERNRLGEDHPLFRTQYLLQTLDSQGRMFTQEQITLLHGDQPPEEQPGPGPYIGGLDIAGAAEQPDQEGLMVASPARDSTVLTIARLDGPVCRTVAHYAWTNRPHHQALDDLARLAHHWKIRSLVADATGLGEPITALLTRRLGRTVTPFRFTAGTKSQLAYDLLALANRGHLAIHQGAPEELWNQLKLARTQVRPNRQLNFYVNPQDGHDDHLMSLALTVHAAASIPARRIAHGTAA